MSRKNKRYSVELKQKVVKEFLDGKSSATELCKKYDISDTKRIYIWVEKYESGDTNFIETCGKRATGRPPKIKPVEQMTKDEYIAHLELENKILKSFAEMLDNKKK